MKPAILVLLLLLLLLFSKVTCAQYDDWKEYKNFYSMVTTVLHPAEYDDLKLVKDSSIFLLQKAKAWEASKIPKEINNDAMKKALSELVSLCSELNNAVLQKKTDEEISLLAIKVHNKFHSIHGRYMIKLKR